MVKRKTATARAVQSAVQINKQVLVYFRSQQLLPLRVIKEKHYSNVLDNCSHYLADFHPALPAGILANFLCLYYPSLEKMLVQQVRYRN